MATQTAAPGAIMVDHRANSSLWAARRKKAEVARISHHDRVLAQMEKLSSLVEQVLVGVSLLLDRAPAHQVIDRAEYVEDAADTESCLSFASARSRSCSSSASTVPSTGDEALSSLVDRPVEHFAMDSDSELGMDIAELNFLPAVTSEALVLREIGTQTDPEVICLPDDAVLPSALGLRSSPCTWSSSRRSTSASGSELGSPRGLAVPEVTDGWLVDRMVAALCIRGRAEHEESVLDLQRRVDLLLLGGTEEMPPEMMREMPLEMMSDRNHEETSVAPHEILQLSVDRDTLERVVSGLYHLARAAAAFDEIFCDCAVDALRSAADQFEVDPEPVTEPAICEVLDAMSCISLLAP